MNIAKLGKGRGKVEMGEGGEWEPEDIVLRAAGTPRSVHTMSY